MPGGSDPALKDPYGRMPGSAWPQSIKPLLKNKGRQTLKTLQRKEFKPRSEAADGVGPPSLCWATSGRGAAWFCNFASKCTASSGPVLL